MTKKKKWKKNLTFKKYFDKIVPIFFNILFRYKKRREFHIRRLTIICPFFTRNLN